MRKLVAALMLAATPFATAVAGDMSYTYVEAGWTEVKIDDDWLDDPKGDGAYIRGSYAIADQVYLFGGYAEVSKTYRLAPGRVKFELAQPEFGIGWHQGFTDRLDFTADLAWVRLNGKVRLSGIADPVDLVDEHVTAGRATVGLRGKPSAHTELWAKAGYLDGSDLDGEWLGSLGLQVNLNRTWGLVGEIEAYEDVTRYNLGVRASF